MIVGQLVTYRSHAIVLRILQMRNLGLVRDGGGKGAGM